MKNRFLLSATAILGVFAPLNAALPMTELFQKELGLPAAQQFYSAYAVLGIPEGADAAAVKKAYKQRALTFHPDKNRPNGETIFKLIEAAKNSLIDDQGTLRLREGYSLAWRTLVDKIWPYYLKLKQTADTAEKIDMGQRELRKFKKAFAVRYPYLAAIIGEMDNDLRDASLVQVIPDEDFEIEQSEPVLEEISDEFK
jgi:hypothetical protein